jgi:hypothetical protein
VNRAWRERGETSQSASHYRNDLMKIKMGVAPLESALKKSLLIRAYALKNDARSSRKH